ncbi:hypothetical protein [Chitinophaga sp. S165]|uniref:hypothetical protein n=1 Tax=Chitinophaga sp. S165 TaxID=2135462 RepID=UPI000D719562|nr:hypothetical protein [Chitinophaga sp. S165]PWV46922.1 hypothetical protein C7475_1099 [Chitinophaga sp. S165]
MELRTVRKLLIKYLEADRLTDEEGERLLAGLEYLIEKDEQHLLLGMKYQADGGEELLLSQEALNGFYWEIYMFYGHHEEDHDHHHDDDHEKTDVAHKWGWLFMLLTGLIAVVVYVLIRKYHL